MRIYNQSGFAALTGLLGIVIIGLIIGTGWYVWQSKIETDSALEASERAATSSTQPVIKTETKSGWTLYTPPSKNYSIELPDGWRLSRLKGEDDLYTFSTQNLKINPNVKAVVEEVDGGVDGTSIGFNLFYPETYQTGGDKPEGEKVKETKTDAGDSLVVYKFVQTEDVDGSGGTPKDATSYTFAVTHAGTRIQAGYGFNKGDEDIYDIVEESIKSIKFLN